MQNHLDAHLTLSEFFSMPLISVIMPAFNVSEYIGEAIESILNQTEKDIELLICDDGSTDDTLDKVKYYKDPRIKVFANITNKGNLTTTNFLFDQCKGEYITIQDADDYSAMNRFELFLKEFQQDPELGMVGCNYEAVDEHKNALYCGLLPLENHEIKNAMEKEPIPMLYAGIMLKKEVYNKVGKFRLFFDRKGYADMDWLSRCSFFCKVKNLPIILYYYRKHSNSFNHQYNINKKMMNDPILSNMNLLLVRAHKIRKEGKKDFFDEINIKEMKFFLSEYYIRIAENTFWMGDYKGALKKLKYAFLLYPKNLRIIKIMIFILRNRRNNIK